MKRILIILISISLTTAEETVRCGSSTQTEDSDIIVTRLVTSSKKGVNLKRGDHRMSKLPKAITFDTYGTLIDWEGEIQNYFRAFLKKKGVSGIDPIDIQRRWETIQFDYIREKYRPYRQVLGDTLGMTCREYGVPFTVSDSTDFADSMGKWRPFPDTHDAMAEIRKLCKTVLLTNTDNDIVAESVKLMGIEVDDIVTAEMAGMYKPGLDGFHLARKRLGLEVKDILHAGFGFKYDVEPATRLGYETCWINRQGEARPSDIKETYLVGDLKTLVLMLKGMAS